MLDSNTWNYLIECKHISSKRITNKTNYKIFTEKSYNHLTVWKEMTGVKLIC